MRLPGQVPGASEPSNKAMKLTKAAHLARVAAFAAYRQCWATSTERTDVLLIERTPCQWSTDYSASQSTATAPFTAPCRQDLRRTPDQVAPRDSGQCRTRPPSRTTAVATTPFTASLFPITRLPTRAGATVLRSRMALPNKGMKLTNRGSCGRADWRASSMLRFAAYAQCSTDQMVSTQYED